MKIELRTTGSIEKVIERIRLELEKLQFIFSEDDKAYAVRYVNGKLEKTQTQSAFWARRQLQDPYPPQFSVEIEGRIELVEGETIIHAEFYEYHNQRKHGAGGSVSLDEHVDLFCGLIQK